MSRQLVLRIIDCLVCCFCCLVGCLASAPCAVFHRPAEGPLWLDCRILELAETASAARHEFVGIRRQDGLLHWELNPPLLSNQSVNRLPAGAFKDLERHLTADVALVLRRLHQRNFSLEALADLPSLRHLVLADSNVTCLPRGALDPAAELVSLSLEDNPSLACLQPGALASLSRLRQLRLTGSPRLLKLDPGVFCGLPSARLSELSLELSPRAQAPASALARLSGLTELRLSTSTMPIPYDSTTSELLTWLDEFLCRLSDSRLRRLRLNGLTVFDHLTEGLHSTIGEFCGPKRDLDGYSTIGNGTTIDADCQDGCSEGCPTSAASSATSTPDFFRQVTAAETQRIWWQQQQQQQQPQQQQPRLERPNLAGTMLLTTSAFLAGVLISLYCFLMAQRRRRLLGNKLQRRNYSWTLQPPAARPDPEAPPVACQDPIQLIGFSRRRSSMDEEGNGQKLLPVPAAVDSNMLLSQTAVVLDRSSLINQNILFKINCRF